MTYDKTVTKAQKDVRKIYREAKEKIAEAVMECLDECLPEEKADADTEEKKQLLAALKADRIIAIAYQLYTANRQAKRTINDYISEAFADAMNEEAYEIEMELGEDIGLFPLSDEDVSEWLDEYQEVFSEDDINRKKDERWNTQNIRNLIITGVLLGINRDKLPSYVTNNAIRRNRDSMLNNAYNTLSGAGESGRVAAMRNAEIKGVDMQKEWIATLDLKTRDAHRKLDGQRVDLDKPFVVDGDEIWEPRDPTAKAYLRCNCRCGMRRVMKGWQRTGERKENIRHYNEDGTWYKPLVPNMTYADWYKMKVQELGEDEIERQVKEMKREQARKYYRKRKREKNER